MDVSFDAFASLLESGTDFANTKIRVNASPQQSDDQVVTIRSNCKITFDLDHDFSCRTLAISACEVEIHNLALNGAIVVRNGILKLYNARVGHPADTSDELLDASNESQVYGTCCTFGHTSQFGVSADDRTSVTLDRCFLSSIDRFGIVVTGGSLCQCTDCVLRDGGSDHVRIDTSSSIVLTRCSVKRTPRVGIFAGALCSVSLNECVFKDCQQGCLTALQAEQVLIKSCRFLRTGNSCLMFEGPTAVIKRSVITECAGNAVNANKGTKLLISRCTVTETEYPSLAICDESLGFVKHCTITGSQMSGIVVRNGSSATLKECTIEDAKHTGIAVSDQSEVNIMKSFVFGCADNAVSSYNHSKIQVISSFLVGPSRTGINVFTGGFVYATDTAIVGMRETGIWVHHGGSGRFVAPLMDILACDSREEMVARISAIPMELRGCDVPEDKLFRIESKRCFVISGAFVVGKGVLDVVRNTPGDTAKPGLGAIRSDCAVCGEPADDCFFSICGHALYCRRCWDALDEKPTTCALCAVPIEKVCTPISCSHDENEPTCGICLCNEVDAIVVPCGHLICSECGQGWFKQHIECPYCRTSRARVRPFVSYA
jgi:hypothetical protein